MHVPMYIRHIDSAQNRFIIAIKFSMHLPHVSCATNFCRLLDGFLIVIIVGFKIVHRDFSVQLAECQNHFPDVTVILWNFRGLRYINRIYYIFIVLQSYVSAESSLVFHLPITYLQRDYDNDDGAYIDVSCILNARFIRPPVRVFALTFWPACVYTPLSSCLFSSV